MSWSSNVLLILGQDQAVIISHRRSRLLLASLHTEVFTSDGWFARKENDSIQYQIQFPHYYFAQLGASIRVSKVFKVQKYYKTLINHESRCSNSWQEEVWEQRDGAKWEGVWNWNSKCCYSRVEKLPVWFANQIDLNRFCIVNWYFPSLVFTTVTTSSNEVLLLCYSYSFSFCYFLTNQSVSFGNIITQYWPAVRHRWVTVLVPTQLDWPSATLQETATPTSIHATHCNWINCRTTA